MRLFSAFVAGALILAMASPSLAHEKRRKKRDYIPDHRRSSTVDRNGLCQRDTGRTLDSLNLNHHCDREEFWARMRDRGGERGR